MLLDLNSKNFLDVTEPLNLYIDHKYKKWTII